MTQKYYFTLASNHGGPGCVEVHGNDWLHARQRMVAKRGVKWAFQYGSLEEVHQNDRNIVEVID